MALTPLLRTMIADPRSRILGRQPGAEDAEAIGRRKEMEQFQVLLAGKMDTALRFELFLGADYVWIDEHPAVRFEVEGNIFVIRRGDGGCQLFEEREGKQFPLATLTDTDPRFNDRLLVALGSVLDPMQQ